MNEFSLRDHQKPDRRGAHGFEQSHDATVMELVESFLSRLQTGESVTIESFVSEHAEYADQLRDILPAVDALNDLGLSVTGGTLSRMSASDRIAEPKPLQGVLGDFRIGPEIGRGGMSIVYDAEQISLSRRVALKMLPLAAAIDERRIRRFQNEAKLAATLKHPNIVSVYAIGCERGIHFYAMEFVEGLSLAEVVRCMRSDQRDKTVSNSADATTEPIAALSTEWMNNQHRYCRDIARIAADVADALEHAHREGIIHRDVKPSNILLDQQGRAWITDFGLAHVRGEGGLTLSGGILGTARYMSPEQAAGNRILDQRTDIYSLGITLYELLTLRPVFESEERQAVLRDVIERDPPKPRKLDARISRDLETVILKAIDKSPDLRYATSKDFADDLRRCLHHRPVRARRASQVTRFSRWTRRNPLLAASLTLTFLLLSALAVGGTATAFHLAESNRLAHSG
jgi:serine/threonine protein kinase